MFHMFERLRRAVAPLNIISYVIHRAVHIRFLQGSGGGHGTMRLQAASTGSLSSEQPTSELSKLPRQYITLQLHLFSVVWRTSLLIAVRGCTMRVLSYVSDSAKTNSVCLRVGSGRNHIQHTCATDLPVQPAVNLHGAGCC